jgi:hypothetical protein
MQLCALFCAILCNFLPFFLAFFAFLSICFFVKLIPTSWFLFSPCFSLFHCFPPILITTDIKEPTQNRNGTTGHLSRFECVCLSLGLSRSTFSLYLSWKALLLRCAIQTMSSVLVCLKLNLLTSELIRRLCLVLLCSSPLSNYLLVLLLCP